LTVHNLSFSNVAPYQIASSSSGHEVRSVNNLFRPSGSLMVVQVDKSLIKVIFWVSNVFHLATMRL